jgi:hypothetical protein
MSLRAIQSIQTEVFSPSNPQRDARVVEGTMRPITDLGDERGLNEIAVSDRGTSRGLTQFPRTLVVARVKPLNAKKMEERYRNSPACAIICSRPLVSR